MKKRVCHMTSVHRSGDMRIFFKECVSLAKAGHEVFLVAFGEGREEAGVKVVGLGEMPGNRISRILTASKKVYLAAKELDCDIYHLHDPELLPYGLKLKKLGKTVIFDSHEDVPVQIASKLWIPRIFKGTVSRLYRSYETRSVRKLDAVVAATPYIGEQFEGRAKKTVVINNYPKLEDVHYCDAPFEGREAVVCYVGTMDRWYGAELMPEAMKEVPGTLYIAGEYPEEIAERQTLRYPNTVFLGFQNRESINKMFEKSVVGLVMLLPIKNFIDSQPTKMYEYMAAGLPFVASDFPRWKRIVEKWNCGVCVSPDDPAVIGKAIESLLSNRELAQEMGRNGRRAIEQEYNWAIEEKKLVELYSTLA
ncbi:MAG: glycosyltransferase family 4 protein [Ruminococcaceae bacterium]|nr:glycosyltransferase family 4 protein [Oscillospiraceae bacterium]